MNPHSLKDLYDRQLDDLYDAEQRSVKALPAMERSAGSAELIAAFRGQQARAREHLLRLASLFRSAGRVPGRRASRGIKSLLRDCQDGCKLDEPAVRDVRLIALAQHLHHDEIASYGCARSWAKLLGNDFAADVLQRNLNDEKQIDTELSRIAGRVNRSAAR
ncbi:MAG TPA: DUF892 family protein [Phycisphaerae bacterium]|jgi:ferritin-like metal-binding protein YciE